MRVPRLFGMALLLAAGSAFAGDPLRLRWREGQTLRYRVTSTTVQTLERGGTRHGSRAILAQELRRVVGPVDADGTAWVTNRVDSLKCTLESGPNRMEYDSADPATAEQARDPRMARYAGLAGKSFRMRMTVTGNVVAVDGFTRVGEEIAAGLDPEHSATGQVRASLAEHYTDAALLRRQQATSELLPPGPVAEGETWTRVGQLPNPAVGEIALSFTYMFAGTETLNGAPCAHIVGDATLRLPAEPLPGSRYAGGSARLDLGSYRHEAWLDLQGGFLRKAAETVRITLTGERPGTPAQSESVEQETVLEYVGE